MGRRGGGHDFGRYIKPIQIMGEVTLQVSHYYSPLPCNFQTFLQPWCSSVIATPTCCRSSVDSGGDGGVRAPPKFGGSEKGWSLISSYQSWAITTNTSGFKKLSTGLINNQACSVLPHPNHFKINTFSFLLPRMITFKYGILLPKLFWPTVTKKCSSD